MSDPVNSLVLEGRIDPERAERAAAMRVVEPRPGQFRALSDSGNSYYVRLVPDLICSCGDAIHRHTVCKHQLAALILSGHPEMEKWGYVAKTLRRRSNVLTGSPPRWPDNLSLAEALYKLPGRPNDRELIARVITDPAAGPEVYVAVAKATSDETAHMLLLAVTDALRTGAVVDAVAENTTTTKVHFRLLAAATREQFKRIWPAILERKGHTLEVLERLKDSGALDRGIVAPEDLLSFLTSDDAVKRERALGLLGDVESRDLTPEQLPIPHAPERRRMC